MTQINISKIKVNEDELIIKDNEARNNINSLSTNIYNSINSLSTDIYNNIFTNLDSLSTNVYGSIDDLSTSINKLYNINSSNFSPSVSYNIGEYVLYEGLLYRFTSAHSSGIWNLNEVTPVKITSELEGKIFDAPNDGDSYVRKNGTWAIASGGSGGGIGLGDTISFSEDTAVIITGERFVDELYNMNSDEFSPATTYSIGDYCIYEGKLYKFTTTHSAGEWNNSHVTRVNLTNELKSKANFAKEILYYSSQTVSITNDAQIIRIPTTETNDLITTDTVVLECTFENPLYITSDVTWQSYNGYIIFTGTCTSTTLANIVLGTKGN